MKKLIIANWKMNPASLDEARRLFMAIEHRMHLYKDKAEVVVCPPAIYLPPMSHYSMFAHLGAQNFYWQDQGAFTGEISGTQLLNWRVTYAILGHSERRIYFKETDADVKAKIEAALKHKIVPIVCLGGDAKVTKETIKKLVTRQFNAAIKDLDKKQIAKLIYVYEPTFAISTFKNAVVETGEHAAELILHIRNLLGKKIGITHAANVHILYGGSVNKNNVAEFAKYPTIDGALVGAASLDADNFNAIIKEFHRESIHKV